MSFVLRKRAIAWKVISGYTLSAIPQTLAAILADDWSEMRHAIASILIFKE